MKTGLITSNTYKNHNTGDGHPEKIDRVTAVIENFKKIDNKNLIGKNQMIMTNRYYLKLIHQIILIKFKILSLQKVCFF